jgi:LCP family protein required for cell wall assembly
LIVLTSALAAGIFWHQLRKIPMDLPGSGRGTTYLLIGSDSRRFVPPGQEPAFGSELSVPGERADVVVLVRSEGGRTTALGIPRDLSVERIGKGPTRLTLTMLDGPAAVADALCHSLGIGVDHVVVAQFTGLVEMVDEVGGITVESPGPLRDRNTGLQLDAGTNRLDGRQALAYVRSRKAEYFDGTRWRPDPEFSSQRPQRAVQVAQQAAATARRKATGWSTSLPTLSTAMRSVTVDGNTGPMDALRLSRAMGSLDPDRTMSLPTTRLKGPVPVEWVSPASAAAVKQFAGRSGPTTCPDAVLLPKG